jgi:ribulose-5-phosphate 4-epimerase/fuculose-1-phosphate aldolase
MLGGGEAQGQHIAAALGDKSLLVLRGHGVLVIGPTIEQAYVDLYLLELAARTQVLALSTGRPLRRFTTAQAERLASPAWPADAARRHFNAMRQVVDGSLALA